MKTKNKNGKKKKIQINYEVDNMFSTSIKNDEMKVIGYVDEDNFSDFINHYLTDILDAIPTKSLGMVESYIKRRMEEKPIVDNNHSDINADNNEGFSNEQLKYIEQFLKGLVMLALMKCVTENLPKLSLVLYFRNIEIQKTFK